MRVLKHIAVNLAFFASLCIVLAPAGLAEGQLGHCYIEVIALFLSAVMAIVSALACANRSRPGVITRAGGAFFVLLFLFMVTMFIVEEKPRILEDVTKYWFGAVISVVLIGLQGTYDRRHFGIMLGVRDSEW
jgi:hypothetical protein